MNATMAPEAVVCLSLFMPGTRGTEALSGYGIWTQVVDYCWDPSAAYRLPALLPPRWTFLTAMLPTRTNQVCRLKT